MGPSSLKQFLKSVVPRRLHPDSFAKHKIAGTSQGRVLSGPFRGMRSLTCPEDFVDYPMLLGTYEKELHPLVEEIQHGGFHTLLEIGSAQGYYAVGFAMICPQMRIITFELNPEAREQLTRAARANGVLERITQYGNCDPAELTKHLSDPVGSLIIVDIDGGEAELIDPVKVPALRQATILMEEHECFVPGIIALIEGRFRATHTICRVHQQKRSLLDLCVRSLFWDSWLLKAAHERPPGNSWIYMRPLAEAVN